MIDIRLAIAGDPPSGTATGADGRTTTFIGWAGLLQAVADLAGDALSGDEAPTP